MSLYFNTKTRSNGAPINELLAAHPSLALCACGWNSKQVSISNEDGHVLHNVTRNTEPTSIAWHPSKGVLAIGWKDGQMSVWSNEDPTNAATFPAPAHGNLAVLLLTWSTHGMYLLSSSKNCSATMWQLEGGNSKLASLWTVKTDLPIVHAVHLQSIDKKLQGSKIVDADANGDDEMSFAVSSGNHIIHLLEDGQPLSSLIVLEKDQPVACLLWDSAARHLVSLSAGNMIAVNHVDQDNKVSQVIRRKISAPASDVPTRMVWAAQGVVGLSCGDDKVRLFGIAAEVIYILPCTAKSLTCIAAHTARKLLVVGGSQGETLLFRFNGTPLTQDADDWALVNAVIPEAGSPAAAAIGAIRLLSGGDIQFTQDGCIVTLQETQRKRAYRGSASAYQIAQNMMQIETNQGTKCTLKVMFNIREADLCFPQVAVWTGNSLVISSVNEATGVTTQLSTVDTTSPCFALHTDGIIRAKNNGLVFESFHQQQIAILSFAEGEGSPTHLDVQGDFLVCATTKNLLKIIRIASRELKPMGPARTVFRNHPDVSIARARINANGKRVLLLTNTGAAVKAPDSRLWVFETDTDRVTFYDFQKSNELPVFASWNVPPSATAGELEHLLLACETKRSGNAASKKKADTTNHDESTVEADDSAAPLVHNIATLFSTTHGVVLHHSIPAPLTSALVGLAVPNLQIVNAHTGEGPSGEAALYSLEPKRLRDFEGPLGVNDPVVRDALMRFGYHTTTGNMDEAYRAIRTVKDPSVWTNLAKMCVITKRLDVAEVCLANMNDGVAARAMREAREETELDTKLGILASSLGMIEEAEQLFRKAKRYDLVTELLIACGRWEEAQKHAETLDRIRIRPVSYRYAMWMESIGDFFAAVNYYQKANSSYDTPRMYFMHNRIDELKGMVDTAMKEMQKATDEERPKLNHQRGLISWWAHYMERSGNITEALSCYEVIKDVYNTVRLLTLVNPPKIDQAIDIVTAAANRQHCGAAYFIGHYFVQKNSVQKALQFYNLAGASRRAIQLAKANDLHGEVVAIVLKSEDKQMALETANWFESRGQYEQAVQLYQKGGDIQRAIDVCIRGSLYDVLNQISETLDQAADPETFIQMAEHFLKSELYDKAAQMLIFAKAFNEALQLCVDKNVKLTDEMAEAMSLPKSDNDDDESYRISLLKKIAKVAKEQESWHLACKKYTQAGERVKAMKMLLRAGDTEKVMFFANHSRNNEIYVLAGNYLQSQNWQRDETIYKNIVTFYTKAKAFDNLASFYDTCSQLQIDEYRNYDTALATLKEALKALEKGDCAQHKRMHFASRIQIVEQFVNARKMIQPGKPCVEMVQICTDLITSSRPEHPNHELVDASIRVGDVYALLVEYYDKLGQAENAYSLMDRMRQQGIELTFFVDQQLVQRICQSVGRDPKPMLAPTTAAAVAQSYQRHVPEPEENFVEEEI